MPTTYRCISTMLMESGLPDDVSVNTFHVQLPTGVDNFNGVRLAWQAFMATLVAWFPETVPDGDHPFRMYNLASPEPRAPVYDATWAFGSTPTGTPLPAEVALCVSFQGNRVSGENQARRRGRIYLGPLSQSRNDGGRPSANLLDDVALAFKDFTSGLNDAGYYFVVHSRADNDDVIVTNCWVDNAFDTQRRRGIAPTARQTQNFTQTL